MKIPGNLILRLLLAYGIMKREEFEALVARLLSGYVDQPEKLSSIADFIFGQMADLKNYLTLEQIVDSAVSKSQKEIKEELLELKRLIEQLTEKPDNQTQS